MVKGLRKFSGSRWVPLIELPYDGGAYPFVVLGQVPEVRCALQKLGTGTPGLKGESLEFVRPPCVEAGRGFLAGPPGLSVQLLRRR